MNVEPDWVVAQREDNRRFNNIWKGMFVGSGLSAAVIALVFSVERETYLAFGGYAFMLATIASIYVARRSAPGSLARSGAVTTAILFAFAAMLFLLGGARP